MRFSFTIDWRIWSDLSSIMFVEKWISRHKEFRSLPYLLFLSTPSPFLISCEPHLSHRRRHRADATGTSPTAADTKVPTPPDRRPQRRCRLRSTVDSCLHRFRLSAVYRKLRDYVRYDLKEIAFPSSLPDPPHFKKRRKLTWKERYLVMKEATRLYAASWVRDIGPELRPNEYKNKEKSGDEGTGPTTESEPSTLEDLAVAARGGMETLRPALQRVYMTRASAYRDALKSFIEGYQQGIQQVMEKKDSDTHEPQQQNNEPKKST
ncbi:hypothetical protein LXL04_036622 [Taraxacum kok-saghyz]